MLRLGKRRLQFLLRPCLRGHPDGLRLRQLLLDARDECDLRVLLPGEDWVELRLRLGRDRLRLDLGRRLGFRGDGLRLEPCGRRVADGLRLDLG